MPGTEPPDWTCPRCGGPLYRPSRAAQLRRWFNDGGALDSGMRCAQCGEQSAVALARYAPRPTATRWLHLPWDLLTAVRAERRREPVPRFYAVVAAVSLVPAAALARFSGLGRRAWLTVPTAAWAAAFAWSLASALPGGRALQAVTEVVAPRSAARRMAARDRELARTAAETLPIVVPSAWDGRLSIGGVGYSEGSGGPVLNQITISDESREPASPATLTIRVLAFPEPELDDDALWNLAIEEAGPAPPELFDDRDGRAAERLQRRHMRRHADIDQQAAQLAEQWEPATVHLDGQPLAARRVRTAHHTVLSCEIDGCRVTITLRGAAADPLELVRVTDPEPLIAGMADRWRGAGRPPGGA